MAETNRYSRLISWIEDVFEDSEAEILSVSEIVSLLTERFNPRHPLTRRRVSSFLRRRPQFNWCLSARMVNSNMYEHWYSLGPTTWQKDVYVIGNWVAQGQYGSSHYKDISDINLICISWNEAIR